MKILVIEDDHKIANSIKKGLEHEAYSVDVAYDGIEGLDFATEEAYELIILDWMLPGMSGIELCKQVRQAKVHTPILLLTAKSQSEDIVEGLNAGADDYVTKPFAFQVLLARIKALRRRPKQSISTVLSVGDLTLNSITYEVQRAGKGILLSHKEFALLEYLMNNENKTISKEQILNSVWDYDADVVLNSVEVYMTHLRNKIDKPFPKLPPLFKTMRGFGYKISAT